MPQPANVLEIKDTNAPRNSPHNHWSILFASDAKIKIIHPNDAVVGVQGRISQQGSPITMRDYIRGEAIFGND